MFTTIKLIAACAGTARARASKHSQTSAAHSNAADTVRRRCARIHTGADNTTKLAGNLPDSEVFSRSESFGFGRDGVNREATRTTNFVLSTSRPPVALDKAASGYQSQLGAETMTKVNTPTTSNSDNITDGAIIARICAIENALTTALFHIRQPYSPKALQAATGRAIRAASMLKQACTEVSGVAA